MSGFFIFGVILLVFGFSGFVVWASTSRIAGERGWV